MRLRHFSVIETFHLLSRHYLLKQIYSTCNPMKVFSLCARALQTLNRIMDLSVCWRNYIPNTLVTLFQLPNSLILSIDYFSTMRISRSQIVRHLNGNPCSQLRVFTTTIRLDLNISYWSDVFVRDIFKKGHIKDRVFQCFMHCYWKRNCALLLNCSNSTTHITASFKILFF